MERPRRLPDGQSGERQKDAQGKTYKEGPLRFGESHGHFTHYKPQYLLERKQEGGGVFVSFGMGRLSKRRSFPRKRESTRQTFGSALSSDWIPAFAGMTRPFAGMTGGSSGSPFQMTPAPAAAYSVGRLEASRRAADTWRAAGSEDMKSEMRGRWLWSEVGLYVVGGPLIGRCQKY